MMLVLEPTFPSMQSTGYICICVMSSNYFLNVEAHNFVDNFRFSLAMYSHNKQDYGKVLGWLYYDSIYEEHQDAIQLFTVVLYLDEITVASTIRKYATK